MLLKSRADRARELRRQQLVQDRIEAVIRNQLRSEITAATRTMANQYARSGNVTLPDSHVRNIGTIINRCWQQSIESAAKRVDESAKSAGRDLINKNETRWTGFALQYVSDVGGDAIVNVSETTVSQVRRSISAGLRDGLSQREIAQGITNRAPAIALVRAQTIARTEVHSAFNYGAIREVETQGVATMKEWISAQQEGRTRDAHLEADEQQVPMDGSFIVDGEPLAYPGDPAGSAGNIIKCRCGIGFVVV